MKVLYSKKNGITNKLSGVNLPVDADEINYDNTESELQSTNVQDAIDEVVDALDDKVDKVVGKGLSTNDYDNTDKAKVGKIDETTTSVTGNPISITGLKSNQLAKDPIITLEPIQAGSGDPSPSNVRAISGYDKIEVLSCGKNLCDEQWRQGDYDSYSTATSSRVSIQEDSRIHLKAGVTYYFYNGQPVLWSAALLYNKYDTTYFSIINWGDSAIRTYTPDIDCYIAIVFAKSIDTDDISVSEITKFMVSAVEITSASDYEPYTPVTDIQLTLGQTIYGGTLDVEKGILTVDKGYRIINGREDMSFTGYSIAVKLGTNDIDINNVGQTILNDGVYGANNSAIYTAQEYDWEFYTTPYSCYSLEAFKTYVQNSNIQLVYPLADSAKYTIQLTPHEISLLKDYAYVSTNGTNMSFSYKNGEMASLGDVAQVGETVNLLGDYVNTFRFKQFEYQYDDSTTAFTRYTISNAKSTVFKLPSNANIIGIIPRDAGWERATNIMMSYNISNDAMYFSTDSPNTDHLGIAGVVMYTIS